MLTTMTHIFRISSTDLFCYLSIKKLFPIIQQTRYGLVVKSLAILNSLRILFYNWDTFLDASKVIQWQLACDINSYPFSSNRCLRYIRSYSGVIRIWYQPLWLFKTGLCFKDKWIDKMEWANETAKQFSGLDICKYVKQPYGFVNVYTL